MSSAGQNEGRPIWVDYSIILIIRSTESIKFRVNRNRDGYTVSGGWKNRDSAGWSDPMMSGRGAICPLRGLQLWQSAWISIAIGQFPPHAGVVGDTIVGINPSTCQVAQGDSVGASALRAAAALASCGPSGRQAGHVLA